MRYIKPRFIPVILAIVLGFCGVLNLLSAIRAYSYIPVSGYIESLDSEEDSTSSMKYHDYIVHWTVGDEWYEEVVEKSIDSPDLNDTTFLASKDNKDVVTFEPFTVIIRSCLFLLIAAVCAFIGYRLSKRAEEHYFYILPVSDAILFLFTVIFWSDVFYNTKDGIPVNPMTQDSAILFGISFIGLSLYIITRKLWT